MSNAIVLMLDRLGSGCLGPYGNTWIETPAWNRLAARSMLIETALVDSPRLPVVYDSYWYGRHALSARHALDVPPLAERLAASDIESWLVTDEPQVASHALARGFHERVTLPGGEAQAADHLEQTQLARLFATVIDVLEEARPPFLIWVHAQAMEGPWDAPYELRSRLADEEDPEPPRLVEPPEAWLTEDCDPDELLGYQQAYGGQVSLLDNCLDVFLEALAASSASDTTALLATAPRGFPLGEHHYIGRREALLHAEWLHVPWLFCDPRGGGAAFRAPHLVQPPDLYATVLDWFGLSLPAVPIWGRSTLPHLLETELAVIRELAASTLGHERALRVPAWFLRHTMTGPAQLYVKPDDRWECNEIADRCTDVASRLSELLQVFEAAARADDRSGLPALDDLLRGELE
ncbi:MAG: sulfatase-like hydrolase/transferase [Pirellulaceae bacterium]|jgi:arylsulfatase A-like enzyme|nr:sulfatase-like hydrolase/transferase [Pirellulaceae bacterium]